MSDERLQGRVSSLGKNGYGFITAANGDEFFFHATALPQNQFEADVTVGTKVTFRAASTPKGPRALEVRIVRNE